MICAPKTPSSSSGNEATNWVESILWSWQRVELHWTSQPWAAVTRLQMWLCYTITDTEGITAWRWSWSPNAGEREIFPSVPHGDVTLQLVFFIVTDRKELWLHPSWAHDAAYTWPAQNTKQTHPLVSFCETCRHQKVSAWPVLFSDDALWSVSAKYPRGRQTLLWLGCQNTWNLQHVPAVHHY